MSKDLQKLIKKAQSKNDIDRYNAVIEIADLAEVESIQPLSAMIHDTSDDVKLVVASTLGFLGERHKNKTPVPALVEMLQNVGDNLYLKKQIIDSLGMIQDPEVGWMIDEQLPSAESDPDLLTSIINALGKVNYRKASTKILKYIKHEEESVRLATVTALGMIGDMSIIDALFEAADDVSSEVAGNAIISIGKVGDKTVLNKLFEMLEQEPRLPSVLEAAIRDAIDMIK